MSELGLSWQVLLFGPLIGYSVGILTGFFGAGGGFIVTPVLNIFLGLEMNMAVGTSACQVLGASAFSLFNHLDRRLMGIKVALCIGTGIPFGSYLGVSLVQSIKGMTAWHINNQTVDPVNFILLSVFAIFLFFIGAWMFVDNFYLRRNKPDDDANHVGMFYKFGIPPLIRFRTIPAGSFSLPVLVSLGGTMGFLSGLLGIGGGVIMLPMLFYLVGQETKFATQTDMMLIFVSGLFSTVFHAVDKNINYVLAIALMTGAFWGTKTGGFLQRKVNGRAIRKYFSFVILAALALVVYKLADILFFNG